MPSIAQIRRRQLAALPTLAEREARYMRRVLLLAGGNVKLAAEVLGIGKATLYRRIDELGILIDRRADGRKRIQEAFSCA
jgi:transcriptional regulator of acetoin/glycerol metabolism